MRLFVRYSLVLLAFSVVYGSPARADHRRALGVGSQTERGHIDTTNAVTGADIYSCDSLDTDDGGVLRVKVGPNQLFLSASSTAALEDDGNAIQGLATTGTVGFALAAAS